LIPHTFHATDRGIRETGAARPSMVDRGKRKSARIRDMEVGILRYVDENPGTRVRRIHVAEHVARTNVVGSPGTADIPVPFARSA
jgi:hypothetical protein